jgi:hypothetical protein
MDLQVLLDPIDLPRLQKVLDELGHVGRLDTVRGWDRDTLARLYEAAQGFKPVTLDDYVPPGTEPLKEVIHHGKNSLPAFTHFQKRFCKPAPEQAASGDLLYGYNHNSAFLTGITGPGYYVANKSKWDASEVDIDYTRLPPGKPDAWPVIKDNEHGFGRLVYGNMIDVMRGISSHVSIGRARRLKNGSFEWFDAWFVLCREDPS